MKKGLIALVLLFACVFFKVAQDRKYSMANVHSHNDYEQSNPFYAAYEAGAGSIEADIFLRNGELYVSHDTAGIRADRTLSKMYLEPLKQLSPVRKVVLLIDLKTTAEPTLTSLVNLLKQYQSLTTSSNLKIVISGNRPPSAQWTSYPAWIFFDGRPNEDYDEVSLARVGMISDNFKKYTDPKKIKSIIKDAHKLKKPFRFWATPDTPDAWSELMKLKVDYINTDKIADIAQFMQKQ